MTDTTLVLGGIQFQDFQIPARISAGGSHALVTHKLIGGTRVIDAMGRDDADLPWDGWFLGSGAVAAAKAIDQFRIDGSQQTLTWGEFSYLVVIRSFTFDYETFYRIPYRIVCEVVQDNTNVLPVATSVSTDSAISTDLTSAQGYASSINDPTLNGLMASLSVSIGGVSTFANASPSLVASVQQPLAAVQGQISVLLGNDSASMDASPGFAGVQVGADFGISASALGGQISVASQSYNLTLMQSVCGRMQNNLIAINASDKTITVAGGNLFQIASQQYGDSDGWAGIAQANGLTSPFIDGVTNLAIPPSPGDSGGILNA